MDDGDVSGDVAIGLGVYGREDAVQIVENLLAEGGSAVAVGAPGAGKTSLMKVAAQMAAHHGRRVLTVTPTQFEHGLPFAGLAELLSQCPEADRDLPAPQRHALAVALHNADPDGAEVNALAVPLAVRGVLQNLCQAQPVALLLDDLQWLDASSAGSFGFAIRGATAEQDRLSVLVGTRPDPDGGGDLLRSLTEPRRDFALRPLDDSAIGQLLRRRLGPRWTPPMAAGIARASAGNPFLALEIAKAMDDGKGRSARYGHDHVFPVPPTLSELLGERAARLPRPAREVLLLVSAAGRLTVGQLRAIVEPDRLADALDDAADAEVAAVGADSAVAFTHPLLSSAIYDAATAGERRRAHRTLADSLDDPVERARHRAKSSTVPDEAIAGELERAAEISQARGAQQLAGELLESAALATPSGTPGRTAFDRWMRAVATYIDAGDEIAANTALDKGSALAEAAEQQAEALILRSRLADKLLAARVFLEQAFALVPPGSALRAEILHGLGMYRRCEGRGPLALRLTQMAIAQAALHNRVDVQLSALNERQAIERLWGIGDPAQSLREFQQVASGLDATFEGWVQALAHAFFASWDDPDAEGRVRAAIAAAITGGRYAELSDLYVCLILVLTRASDFRQAHAALEEADRSGAWTKTRDGSQRAMARLLVKSYTGEIDEARALALAAENLPLIAASPYWRGGFLAQLGFVEVSAGRWQEALEVLRRLADSMAATGIVDLEQMLWAVDYADAALQTGSIPEVEAAIAVLRRQAAAGRREAAVAADRCQALLTAARGDAEQAAVQLRALAGLPAAECPFEQARTRLALGQAYRRAGYKAKANETLAETAETFARLGAPRWAERALAEADRTGMNSTADSGSLTPTERRVAELVGKGLSNQETADQLFMSVKTVEANLTRIYRKLDVRSRTELANRIMTLM